MDRSQTRRAIIGVGLLIVVLSGIGVYSFGAVPFVPRSVADVKYSVMDHVSIPLVCTGWGQPNPPFEPAQTYPSIVTDVPTYVAILRRLHMPIVVAPDQVVAVYRESLKLDAIHLDRKGSTYSFEMYPGGDDKPEALRHQVVGTVDLYGHVSNVHEASAMGACLL